MCKLETYLIVTGAYQVIIEIQKNSSFKSVDEVIELCTKLEDESLIYLYFADTGNRICIHLAENNLVNVDLQYSDPYCDGDVTIAGLRTLLVEYEHFQRNPEQYGLKFNEM